MYLNRHYLLVQESSRRLNFQQIARFEYRYNEDEAKMAFICDFPQNLSVFQRRLLPGLDLIPLRPH